MVKKTFDYKIPGGKLVRITIEYDECIRTITINGDFFLYPEEALHQIEEGLTGCSLERGALAARLHTLFSLHHATGFGITPEGVADAILGAVHG